MELGGLTIETEVLVGVLGALVAILAVTLDRAFDRAHDRRRWQRDERSTAYLTFASSYFAVWNKMRAIRPSGPIEHAALYEVNFAAESFKSSLARVRLLGEPRVYLAAAAVYGQLDRIVPTSAELGRLSVVEWDKAHQRAHYLLADFIDEARKSLGVTEMDLSKSDDPLLWFTVPQLVDES